MKEAEEMYLRALTGKEKDLGAEHKQPLHTRFNMALLYKEKNLFQDVTEQLEVVVQGCTKVLGPDHWETVEVSELLNSWKSSA